MLNFNSYFLKLTLDRFVGAGRSQNKVKFNFQIIHYVRRIILFGGLKAMYFCQLVLSYVLPNMHSWRNSFHSLYQQFIHYQSNCGAMFVIQSVVHSSSQSCGDLSSSCHCHYWYNSTVHQIYCSAGLFSLLSLPDLVNPE